LKRRPGPELGKNLEEGLVSLGVGVPWEGGPGSEIVARGEGGDGTKWRGWRDRQWGSSKVREWGGADRKAVNKGEGRTQVTRSEDFIGGARARMFSPKKLTGDRGNLGPGRVGLLGTCT